MTPNVPASSQTSPEVGIMQGTRMKGKQFIIKFAVHGRLTTAITTLDYYISSCSLHRALTMVPPQRKRATDVIAVDVRRKQSSSWRSVSRHFCPNRYRKSRILENVQGRNFVTPGILRNYER